MTHLTQKKLGLLLILSLSASFAFASPLVQKKADPASKIKTSDLVEPIKDANTIKRLRINSIKETVYATAFQKEVNEAYKKIEKTLQSMEVSLDRIYSFEPFMLDNGRVLPPIILESSDNLKIITGNEAVSSLRTYTIERQAKIGSHLLSWRDYLKAEPLPVQTISPTLLPKNAEEKRAWQDAEKRGQVDGKKEALSIFKSNVARLTRDLTGAIRFHRLERQHIISSPTLAVGTVDTEINGKQLSIGKTIYRLTEHAIYQEHSQWKVKPTLTTNP